MSDTSSIASGALEGRNAVADRPLFPLGLTPFEQFMLLDDRVDYPMVFVIAIRVSGELLRDEFDAALQVALDRHPLLTCFVQRCAGAGLCWVPSREHRPQLDWADDNRPLTCPTQEHIDLTREHGLRIWVRREQTQARVSFQFHHACCDGLGAVQFIGDLLAAYGQRTVTGEAEPPELAAILPDRLLARANFSAHDFEEGRKSFASPWVIARRLFKLLRRSPVPLAAAGDRRPLSVPDLPFPAIITRVLERSVVQQLKAVAARKAVALNDLYLLEMFQTIRQWNRDRRRAGDHHWLRICMPTSLRTPRHDQMPAANVMSCMFLTRRAADCDQPDKLLADIHRQTSAIVNDQQGRFLTTGLKYLLKIPGLLPWLLRWNGCFTTVILANVGEVRRQFTAQFPLRQGRCVAGNVVLESLEGAAHVRPNTRMATSLGTYAGNLYINLHCDPRSFTRQQAEEMADLFTERLQRLIAIDENVARRTA